MANWYPSWTQCSTPVNFYGSLFAGLYGPWVQILAVLLPGVGVITGVVGVSLPLLGWWTIPVGINALLAVLCAAAIVFCAWWLKVRLICLGRDRSVVGAIYHLEKPAPTDNPFNLEAAIERADTDFSFNLLMWQFAPQHQLPEKFVNHQWSPNALDDLESHWQDLGDLVPAVQFSLVGDEIGLIVPQQSMAGLGLGFGGQQAVCEDKTVLSGGSTQHFLMHCEIEGPGMHDLYILMFALFAASAVGVAAAAIPVVGSIISLIMAVLVALAFLIGLPAITHDDASPPAGGGFGGNLNTYDPGPNPNPNSTVDIAYVFGRWVYDSFHAKPPQQSNELHPVYYMCKLCSVTQGMLGKGIWPSELGATKSKYDEQFAIINSPTTVQIQAEPQNRWTLHPLLDGCQATMPYPDPAPPGSAIV